MAGQAGAGHLAVQGIDHREPVDQHPVDGAEFIPHGGPGGILQRHFDQFLVIPVVALHEGVFHQDVAVHDVVHEGVVAVVDADNWLVEIVQHRDVLKQHIADFRVQCQPLVGLVADLHGLGQVGPYLHVFKGDALGGAGDGHKVLLHGRTVRGAALLRGERGQHDRVIRFGGVREIGDLGVEGLDVLLEFLGRVGTWNGAGGALEQARVEVGGMVDGVAVGHVQLMGVEALGGELLDERHGLVEGDDEHRVGVGGLDGRDHR